MSSLVPTQKGVAMAPRIPKDDICLAAEHGETELRLKRSLAEQEALRQAGDPHRLRLDAIARARGWAKEFDATGELDGHPLEGRIPSINQPDS